MDISIDQLVEIANAIVTENKSRPLGASEEAALRAGWEGLRYEDYVEQHNLTVSGKTLKQNAFLLYPLLRQDIGIAKLNKSNLRVTFQRLYRDGVLDQYLGLAHKKIVNQKVQNHRSQASPLVNSQFVGRKSELATISKLSKEKKCILVWGESGIGKTELVSKFSGTTLQDKYLIIRTKLRKEITTEEWAQETLFALGVGRTIDPIKSLSSLLIEQPIALIIDDAEHHTHLYREFISIIISFEIKSIIFVVSDLLIANIHDSETTGIIHIGKLVEFEALFTEYGLKKEEKWIDLYDKYNGNPGQLIHAFNIITKFFSSKVSQFLESSSTVFSENAYSHIQDKELNEIDIAILEIIVEKVSTTAGIIFNTLKNKDSKSFNSESIFERFSYLEHASLIIQDEGKVTVPPIVKRFIQKRQFETV